MPVTDLHTVNLVSFPLNNLGIMVNIIMEDITTFSLGVAGDENITHNIAFYSATSKLIS